MSFEIPSIIQLKQRIKSDIDRELGVSGKSLRRSLTGVLSSVIAGAVYLLYVYHEFIARQLFIDSADSEYLDRFASIWGVSRKPASFSQGTVSFTGVDGTVIPSGSELIVDGEVYETISSTTISSGSALVDVVAQVAGVSQNILEGEKLVLVSPIAGVNSEAIVFTGGIIGGADEEGDEELRARLISRVQLPPHGGAAFDYISWALEVPGVTRAWVFPEYLGDGTVGVSFVQDDENPIIPNSAKVSEVQSYIDDYSRRPVTADVTVFAPIAKVVDLTIAISPNTLAVQTAVENEIRALISREAAPGGALNTDGKIYLSRLSEAISIASGEFRHSIVSINSSAPADIAVAAGEIAVLGTVTWQSL